MDKQTEINRSGGVLRDCKWADGKYWIRTAIADSTASNNSTPQPLYDSTANYDANCNTVSRRKKVRRYSYARSIRSDINGVNDNSPKPSVTLSNLTPESTRYSVTMHQLPVYDASGNLFASTSSLLSLASHDNH
jgi:hypothetical protein